MISTCALISSVSAKGALNWGRLMGLKSSNKIWRSMTWVDLELMFSLSLKTWAYFCNTGFIICLSFWSKVRVQLLKFVIERFIFPLFAGSRRWLYSCLFWLVYSIYCRVRFSWLKFASITSARTSCDVSCTVVPTRDSARAGINSSRGMMAGSTQTSEEKLRRFLFRFLLLPLDVIVGQEKYFHWPSRAMTYLSERSV
jgi:hypothetical protein